MTQVCNKTFNSSNPTYNACVGENGGASIRTYASGYKESTAILLKKALRNSAYLDILVYPIVYNARHYIELSLKSTIEYLDFFNKVLNPKFCAEKNLKTHSLKELMNKIKVLSAVEPRYKEVVECVEDFVSDYYEIDDSAETFRFPLFHNGMKKHLEDQGCINLGDFADQFSKMSEQLDLLDTVNDCLNEEYRVETVACGLSRDVLQQIAQKLPTLPWNRESLFDKIAEEIKTQYSLSANQFSKVIDKIKTHREFSSYFGKEIALEDLSVKRLRYFRKVYENFRNNKFPFTSEEYTTEISKLSKKFTLKELSAIAALREIGSYCGYLSEDYDYVRSKRLNESKDLILRFELLQNKRTLVYIKEGLKKTGQPTLMQVLVDC
ncbi:MULTISPECIES: hypothetical protein [unclassified Fibrobacter]|uniref:hypothetical protein n=1 Tax=unclassified Fibrobacter TaxID=2634177 RepID=UPI0025C39455|nr:MULTISPECIES: hypothetical protein [unclassified Fibrobacter]